MSKGHIMDYLLEGVGRLGDDDFEELLNDMLRMASEKLAAPGDILRYNPGIAYRALQLLRKNEVIDALWELESAFL